MVARIFVGIQDGYGPHSRIGSWVERNGRNLGRARSANDPDIRGVSGAFAPLTALRPFKPSDRPAYDAYHTRPEVYRFLYTPVPGGEQLDELHKRILRKFAKSKLSKADLGRLANVHPSQVGRVCAGDFKTISNNVVQICRVLKVKVPKVDEEIEMDAEWAKANASLRRIWDQTPEGAAIIRRVLDAIADLRGPKADKVDGPPRPSSKRM
ncbi:hypothetical protein [Falsirhodobacter deserti]|uniref:hypothetical protein n=1 Tax=Falsirhodobacter deserti TaxID=1365611 RepID=UPI0019D42652|nr:hypothetical protein [Falsirhodobacter deserti]